jgi:hypothetical protein
MVSKIQIWQKYLLTRKKYIYNLFTHPGILFRAVSWFLGFGRIPDVKERFNKVL